MIDSKKPLGSQTLVNVGSHFFSWRDEDRGFDHHRMWNWGLQQRATSRFLFLKAFENFWENAFVCIRKFVCCSILRKYSCIYPWRSRYQPLFACGLFYRLICNQLAKILGFTLKIIHRLGVFNKEDKCVADFLHGIHIEVDICCWRCATYTLHDGCSIPLLFWHHWTVVVVCVMLYLEQIHTKKPTELGERDSILVYFTSTVRSLCISHNQWSPCICEGKWACADLCCSWNVFSSTHL